MHGGVTGKASDGLPMSICFSIRVLGFLLNVSLGGSYVSHAASERLRKKRFV